MYNIDHIRHVHLEISSRCNASCPLCPRNFYGYPFNDGYIEKDLTLKEVQEIFQPKFVKQLQEIYINGNFGDIVMNAEAVPIIEYFRELNPQIQIKISTNGGARNKNFWEDLARLECTVFFCLDGLSNTHSLYRQNTLYETVIANAQTFINAGGCAVWKMIDFEHNRHQQSTAKEISKSLGFAKFFLVDHGRNQSPVFDKNGKLTHVIGNPHEVDFKVLFDRRKQSEVLLEDIVDDRQPRSISCWAKKFSSVYVSSTGDVYPCCWLGFSPKTYGHGTYHQAANEQFKHLVKENNALEYDLAHCIAWFHNIEKTWTIDTFEQGRLLICNDACGLS